jgi:invasion protein IalB
MLQHLACGAHAARTLFVAISVLASVAMAPEASAQVSPLPGFFLSSWIKSCVIDCRTTKDVYEGGRLIGSISIVETENAQTRYFHLATPDGVVLRDGAQLTIDWDQPLSGLTVCIRSTRPSGGCVAHDYYQVDSDVISRLKRGQFLTMRAVQMNGQAFAMRIDLKDFASVYDGPPTDLKAQFAQQIQPLVRQQGGFGSPMEVPEAQRVCLNFPALREDVEKGAASIRAASERKASREEVCPMFKAFAAKEEKMVKFLTINQKLCGVPADVVTQVKTSHAKTIQIRNATCSTAPAAAAAPLLSDAPGGPIIDGPADLIRDDTLQRRIFEKTF